MGAVIEAPACPYCGCRSELVTGAVIYPHRPDLADKPFWRCHPCDAYVGCHPGTNHPLGRLADKRLRQAKGAARAAFDPLWKAKMRISGCGKGKARGLGYKWLADQLGIDRRDCHIGMMDEATCQRVAEICRAARGAR